MQDIKEIKPKEVNNEIEETDIGVDLDSEIEPGKNNSDKILMIAIAIIILIIAALIGMQYLQEEQPKTIEDLHLLNLDGKLNKDQGYVYEGYSFVFANGLWYTQVQTISGVSLFNIPLHYSPKDLEDVLVEGGINISVFNSNKEIYITFDPLGSNLNYVALAVGEFDQNIIQAFNKVPIAACDKNETSACSDRPIITCENTDKPVLYLQQEPDAKVIFKNNCMIVQGIGPDIVRSTNRLLLKLYGIMQ